jgi:hypothetical protein
MNDDNNLNMEEVIVMNELILKNDIWSIKNPNDYILVWLCWIT